METPNSSAGTSFTQMPPATDTSTPTDKSSETNNTIQSPLSPPTATTPDTSDTPTQPSLGTQTPSSDPQAQIPVLPVRIPDTPVPISILNIDLPTPVPEAVTLSTDSPTPIPETPATSSDTSSPIPTTDGSVTSTDTVADPANEPETETRTATQIGITTGIGSETSTNTDTDTDTNTNTDTDTNTNTDTDTNTNTNTDTDTDTQPVSAFTDNSSTGPITTPISNQHHIDNDNLLPIETDITPSKILGIVGTTSNTCHTDDEATIPTDTQKFLDTGVPASSIPPPIEASTDTPKITAPDILTSTPSFETSVTGVTSDPNTDRPDTANDTQINVGSATDTDATSPTPTPIPIADTDMGTKTEAPASTSNTTISDSETATYALTGTTEHIEKQVSNEHPPSPVKTEKSLEQGNTSTESTTVTAAVPAEESTPKLQSTLHFSLPPAHIELPTPPSQTVEFPDVPDTPTTKKMPAEIDHQTTEVLTYLHSNPDISGQHEPQQHADPVSWGTAELLVTQADTATTLVPSLLGHTHPSVSTSREEIVKEKLEEQLQAPGTLTLISVTETSSSDTQTLPVTNNTTPSSNLGVEEKLPHISSEVDRKVVDIPNSSPPQEEGSNAVEVATTLTPPDSSPQLGKGLNAKEIPLETLLPESPSCHLLEKQPETQAAATTATISSDLSTPSTQPLQTEISFATPPKDTPVSDKVLQQYMPNIAEDPSSASLESHFTNNTPLQPTTTSPNVQDETESPSNTRLSQQISNPVQDTAEKELPVIKPQSTDTNENLTDLRPHKVVENHTLENLPATPIPESHIKLQIRFAENENQPTLVPHLSDQHNSNHEQKTEQINTPQDTIPPSLVEHEPQPPVTDSNLDPQGIFPPNNQGEDQPVQSELHSGTQMQPENPAELTSPEQPQVDRPVVVTPTPHLDKLPPEPSGSTLPCTTKELHEIPVELNHVTGEDTSSLNCNGITNHDEERPLHVTPSIQASAHPTQETDKKIVQSKLALKNKKTNENETVRDASSSPILKSVTHPPVTIDLLPTPPVAAAKPLPDNTISQKLPPVTSTVSELVITTPDCTSSQAPQSQSKASTTPTTSHKNTTQIPTIPTVGKQQGVLPKTSSTTKPHTSVAAPTKPALPTQPTSASSVQVKTTSAPPASKQPVKTQPVASSNVPTVQNQPKPIVSQLPSSTVKESPTVTPQNKQPPGKSSSTPPRTANTVLSGTMTNSSVLPATSSVKPATTNATNPPPTPQPIVSSSSLSAPKPSTHPTQNTVQPAMPSTPQHSPSPLQAFPSPPVSNVVPTTTQGTTTQATQLKMASTPINEFPFPDSSLDPAKPSLTDPQPPNKKNPTKSRRTTRIAFIAPPSKGPQPASKPLTAIIPPHPESKQQITPDSSVHNSVSQTPTSPIVERSTPTQDTVSLPPTKSLDTMPELNPTDQPLDHTMPDQQSTSPVHTKLVPTPYDPSSFFSGVASIRKKVSNWKAPTSVVGPTPSVPPQTVSPPIPISPSPAVVSQPTPSPPTTPFVTQGPVSLPTPIGSSLIGVCPPPVLSTPPNQLLELSLPTPPAPSQISTTPTPPQPLPPQATSQATHVILSNIVMPELPIDLTPENPPEPPHKEFIQLTERVSQTLKNTLETPSQSVRTMLQQWMSQYNQKCMDNAGSPLLPTLSVHFEVILTSCFENEIASDWNSVSALAFLKNTHYTPYLNRKRVFAACEHRNFTACALELIKQSPQRGEEEQCLHLLDKDDLDGAFAQISENVLLSLQLLPRLISKDRKATIRYCVKKYPLIKPWHIQAVSPKEIYLKYLNSLFKLQPHLQSETSLSYHWFKLLLEDSPPPRGKLFTEDNIPLCGAHLVEWRRQHKLIPLLNYFCKTLAPQQLSHLISTCTKVGFWRGVYQVQLAAGNTHDALSTALFCDNVDGVVPLVSGNSSPQDWSCVLSALYALEQKPVHRQHTHNLTLAALLPLMLSALGAIKTIDLLIEFEAHHTVPQTTSPLIKTPPTAAHTVVQLSASNYSAIVNHGYISEVDQSKIRREILESLNAYLWARAKYAIISPQLIAILEAEKSTDPSSSPITNNGTGTAASASTSASASPSPPSASSSSPTAVAVPSFLRRSTSRQQQQQMNQRPASVYSSGSTSFLEDMCVSHWGVAFSPQDKCAYCSLPLYENPETKYSVDYHYQHQHHTPLVGHSVAMPQTVVFPCGHVFHQFCCVGSTPGNVADLSCVSCLVSTMTHL
ncbi:Hermansky-Pudlak syndrome 5 protein [Pelomyxa schiedti]|nr:Hermansky-Pudlak syndrome 5 protein [Pelomyxa schiedti]